MFEKLAHVHIMFPINRTDGKCLFENKPYRKIFQTFSSYKQDFFYIYLHKKTLIFCRENR